MDRYIGRLLDNRYEILEIIGSGGMAVVYKARCHRLNRLVAIKILKDENLADEDFCRRFHAESQAVAMLSHPNIVSVYDVSSTDDQDYIVMELIDGITLKQYMEKKGVLSWRETVHFATHIARALEHAHSRGLVHRDIKPHNVMVLKNGSVKVADFGIARMMENNNTMTKEALGSVHYISPEQAKGGRVDNRSDIYSLGVVMYEMITGRTPYDGDSPVAVAIQHINGGAPRPSTINPGMPKGLEQIIMKAMAHDLQDRYINATALLEDLDKFRNDPTTTFHTVELPIIPGRPADLRIHPTRPPVDHGGAQPSSQPRQTAGWETEYQPSQETDEPYEMGNERKDRTSTIAIIFCSVAAIIAIIIFMILLTQENYLSADAPVGESGSQLYQMSSTGEKNSGDGNFLFDLVQPIPQQSQSSATQTSNQTDASQQPQVPQPEIIDASSLPVLMKNLVRLTREQAQELLTDLGLFNITWAEEESSQPNGTVIGQSVAPGTAISADAAIKIVCAAGTKTLDCRFELPFRTESFYVTVLLDGRPVVLEQRMDAFCTSIEVSLTGRGNQSCQIYIDGILYQTLTVNFDA